MSELYNIDGIIKSDQLFLISGPCVAESAELLDQVAERLRQISETCGIPVIFKSSFKKANRLSGDSYSGPGLEAGLKALERVKQEHGLPILTDVHETSEISAVAEVADVIQIPAFLCRQTDLVRGAAETGRWVNIKKGQFLAPEDMAPIANKANPEKVMLTERGTSFGYRNLVVDFRSLVILARTGAPVVFDATHSVQLPGAAGGASGGQPEFSLPLARAAVAVGVDGIFIETHPEPARAKSDSASQLALDQMESFVREIVSLHRAIFENAEETKQESASV